MIAIDNINGNGGTVDLSVIYNKLKNLDSSISNLESLTSYGNEISNLNLNTSILNSSINDLSQIVVSNSTNIDILKNSMVFFESSLSDITDSLTTLNGVFTANSFNNQAFNTTLNLNSDMFFTGQFGLNSGSINCNGGIWDLRELRKHFASNITAKNLCNLTMDNFNLSYCDLSFSNKCCLEDCNLTQCSITGNFINLDNCKFSRCQFDDRTIEFKNISFLNTINFYNGGILSFCEVDFKPSEFIISMYSGNYRIYIVNCLYNGTTANADAFKNMFQNGGGAYREYALF